MENKYQEYNMNILHRKGRVQTGKDKDIAGKILGGWDVDTTGKVLNYSGQFHAQYLQLKENRQAVV